MQIEVEDIRRLDVKAGETLVVRFPLPATAEHANAARANIREALPEDVKLLCIFGGPVEMEVVADADAAAMQDPA